MTKQEQVDFLNETVWCRLAPSKIHGIGVFAIRDIPKGTAITHGGHDFFNLTPDEMDELGLHPEIKNLILDRHAMGSFYSFQSPNVDADLQCFMNHSLNPNSTGHTALRDIQAGEEVTENYRNLAGALNLNLQKVVEQSYAIRN